MKNREKFEKEIMDIACSGHSIAFDKKANKLTDCDHILCGNCAFHSSISSCRDKCKKWSESEYKEPEVDWSKVPVDTPVLVSETMRGDWYNRYFSKYKNDTVYTYFSGATSWSSDYEGEKPWRYAKLANEEDIIKYVK